MTGDTCIVCRRSRKSQATNICFHRFPKDPTKRFRWLSEFGLSESQLTSSSRVCSRHFRDGDPRNGPQLTLGSRFASPMKKDDPRAKRAMTRQLNKDYVETQHCGGSGKESIKLNPPTTSLDSSSNSSEVNTRSIFSSDTCTPLPPPSPPHSSPAPPSLSLHEPRSSFPVTPMMPPIEYEEYSGSDDYSSSCVPPSTTSSFSIDMNHIVPVTQYSSNDQVIVSKALLARIEFLESENTKLKKQLSDKYTTEPFSIDQIKDDDKLISFYTGFRSYSVYLAFYNFLGPAVDRLNYWGTKNTTPTCHRLKKVTPINQLLMTLMRLRLNLKVTDLCVRFQVSATTVSRYITTWICFLYQHLKEIDWMPSVEQVSGTLPPAFQENFPSTYAIIDGSEIFMETPSDLHMQSSTWSNYKHHNTAKFLIACTPNGSICFISSLYVGSISDVEITRVSGFLTQLKDKPGISIMADRGFTIKDMLKEIGVELNIPPFMEGRQQLPREEVEKGRCIASVRIHVERAIGRIKTFSILKETLPITLARLSNQIVFVCAYLSNFKPVLVQSSDMSSSDMDVDKYFEGLSDECSEDELSEDMI